MLKEILSKVDEQERQIGIFHAVKDLKHREFAQIIDIPLGTILWKYSRAIKFTSIKVKGIEISMTVTSSSEYGAVSAFWVYIDGSNNIYNDGISKNGMIKIKESMII
jgi:hypothetical protein